MKRVSLRTLLLLTELLAIVVVHQFLLRAPPVQAGTAWPGSAHALVGVWRPLNEDPSEPVDPNAVDDPNEPENPQPEYIGARGSCTWLDEEPVDPNTPEEPEEPPPEAV